MKEKRGETMKAKKGRSLFKTETYKSRKERVNYLAKPDTVFANMFTVYFVTAFCVFADLYLLKIRWNLVQTENPLFVWCSALTCAIALDIPLSIAGIMKKKYDQGLCEYEEKKLTTILAIAIFGLAYLCNFGFVWVTRDLVFEIGAASTLVDNTISSAVSQENQTMIYAPTIYAAIMPFLTSLTTYVICYFAYDPLGDLIKKHRLELIGIENNLKDIEVALVEADDTEKFREKEVKYENMKHAIELNRLDDENQFYKQQCFEIIAEEMKTPDQNGKIAKYSKDYLNEYRKVKG